MDLSRFHEVDAGNHDTALQEIRRGDKRGHWMWYVFPQLRGLGISATAQHFGLLPEEAAAYLADPVLGPRLVAVSNALMEHAHRRRLDEIFGPVDALKLRSSMTLFAAVPGADPVFGRVLATFCDGRCARTVEAVRALKPAPKAYAHDYTSRVVWTGNRGEGTAHYKAYDRTWDVAVPGKAVIHCSNDPLLGGDPGKMNPEDLLLSALSACHMLWFLHYASENGIVVTRYEDSPVGRGEVGQGGAGRFVDATLRPVIHLRAGADLALAEALHHRIPEVCFIARSVAFPVHHAPRHVIAG